MQVNRYLRTCFPHSGKDLAHTFSIALEHQTMEEIMSKFLWFLGGCATGLLVAAAIGYSCEDSANSADRVMPGDEEPEDFAAAREDVATFQERSSSDGPADPDVIVPTV